MDLFTDISMTIFNNIFNYLMHILGLRTKKEPEPVVEKVYVEEQTEPKRNKIDLEPILGFKDNYLVMVVQHRFENIPSWVEWDSDRKTVTITQMNGDIDEAKLDLKTEQLERLKNVQKLLLVSNDNEEKIMHYVQFLARL